MRPLYTLSIASKESQLFYAKEATFAQERFAYIDLNYLVRVFIKTSGSEMLFPEFLLPNSTDSYIKTSIPCKYRDKKERDVGDFFRASLDEEKGFQLIPLDDGDKCDFAVSFEPLYAEFHGIYEPPEPKQGKKKRQRRTKAEMAGIKPPEIPIEELMNAHPNVHYRTTYDDAVMFINSKKKTMGWYFYQPIHYKEGSALRAGTNNIFEVMSLSLKEPSLRLYSRLPPIRFGTLPSTIDIDDPPEN